MLASRLIVFICLLTAIYTSNEVSSTLHPEYGLHRRLELMIPCFEGRFHLEDYLLTAEYILDEFEMNRWCGRQNISCSASGPLLSDLESPYWQVRHTSIQIDASGSCSDAPLFSLALPVHLRYGAPVEGQADIAPSPAQLIVCGLSVLGALMAGWWFMIGDAYRQ
eukprot:gnl/Dysnectes_brevis/8388_a14863_230.p1 GENE.gnl/Dysnectes_brevis/8388_a14863_230~~gnl/Dysnectes_brevis/8388_a14863_230.p1  ORF type:complete len:165 (-),score=6.30 gnl/Dysnectes_brevis/8388_a14863_230:45-539(-)